MKLIAATLAVLSLAASAQAEQRKPVPQKVAPPLVREVTPALAAYTDEVLFGDVWQRPVTAAL